MASPGARTHQGLDPCRQRFDGLEQRESLIQQNDGADMFKLRAGSWGESGRSAAALSGSYHEGRGKSRNTQRWRDGRRLAADLGRRSGGKCRWKFQALAGAVDPCASQRGRNVLPLGFGNRTPCRPTGGLNRAEARLGTPDKAVPASDHEVEKQKDGGCCFKTKGHFSSFLYVIECHPTTIRQRNARHGQRRILCPLARPGEMGTTGK